MFSAKHFEKKGKLPEIQPCFLLSHYNASVSIFRKQLPQ